MDTVIRSTTCGMVVVCIAAAVASAADVVDTVLIYAVEPSKDPSDTFDMDKLIDRIERRINAGAGKEVAAVRRLEGNRIEIRVADGNAEAVKRIEQRLDSEGYLEFRILANRIDHADIIAKAKATDDAIVYEEAKSDKPKTDKTELARWVFVREPSSTLHVDDEITRKSNSGKIQILVINDDYNITGSLVEHTRPANDPTGRPCIEIVFNRRGEDLIRRFTTENLPDHLRGFGRRLAIILDGVVVCAPTIQAQIGAKAQITGKFSRQEVDNLAAILNSGMLPVRVKRIDSPKVD